MSKPRVTVMGSFIVDLMARAHHLPVHGETVKGTHFMIGPGGKGSNQGVAACRSGSSVTMITKIGTDQFSSIALNSFRKEGMSTAFVFEDARYPTGTALIMVDENTSENQIIVTPGACDHISEAEIESAGTHIGGSKVLLTQLETNIEALAKAIQIAHSKGVKVILNPAPAPLSPLPDELLSMIDILTPNETEASVMSGIKVSTFEDAEKAAGMIKRKGIKTVIITMGGKGAFVSTQTAEYKIDPFKVNVLDTTGAGDAFNGGLATALAEGMDIHDAVQFANATGALSVTKLGTAPSMPYRNEIDELLLKKQAEKGELQ
ncbi:MAG TPA: ribokinase [Desulfomonilia bacterium]